MPKSKHRKKHKQSSKIAKQKKVETIRTRKHQLDQFHKLQQQQLAEQQQQQKVLRREAAMIMYGQENEVPLVSGILAGALEGN